MADGRLKKFVYISLSFGCIFCSHVSRAQLNGTYTVGGIAPDYATITDAVNDLIAQGVDGTVIFNLRAGIYNEEISIPAITGASAANTVTFQSEQLDTASVKWEYQGVLATQNFVVQLNGADFIHFRYLTLRRIISGSYGGRVLTFENSACNNVVEYCHFRGKNHYLLSLYEIIYSPNTIDTGNIIRRNYFEQGGRTIYFTAPDTSSLESSNIFEGNIVTTCNEGINLNYQKNCRVTGNDVSISSYQNYDIHLYRCPRNILVGSNVLYSGSGAGILIDDCDGSISDSVIVVNNMIRTGGYDGISVTGSSRVYVLYNSIKGTGSGYPCNFSYSMVLMYNNILSQFNNGVAWYLIGTSIFSDHNEIYTGGATLIKNGTNYTLAQWQTISGQDSNSVDAKPLFVSDTDLHVSYDMNLGRGAFPLSYVTTDIDGDARPANPDIGADEFPHPDYEVGMLSVNKPDLRSCPGSRAIKVDFRNYGTQTITGIDITYQVNENTPVVFHWTGSKITGETASNVTIGNLQVMKDSTYDLKVWTSMPNGFADTIHYNDTVTYGTIESKMTGAYTIGGVNPSYATFNQSVAALIDRGICSDVVFNVRPGTYPEAFILPPVNGSSASSWITWQSETLDSADVFLQLTDAYADPLITLHSCTHIRFRYLSIRKTDDPYWHWDALVANDYGSQLHHIEFEHCHFSSTYWDGFMVSFFIANNMVFRSNLFDHGSGGVAISQNFPDHNYSIVVDQNTFHNVYYGVKINLADSVVISKNILDNDFLTGGGATAIGVGSAGDLHIYENKIDGLFGNGINAAGIGPGTCMIYNNFISILDGFYNAGSGIWGSGTQLQIIHNTILLLNSDSIFNEGNFAIRIDPSYGVKVMNNILVLDSLNTAFYFLEDYWMDWFDSLDHNDIYMLDTSAKFCNVSNWPGSFSADSISIDPMFISPHDLHVQNPALSHRATQMNLPIDFDEQPRFDPPALGADEIMPLDIKPESLSWDQVICDSILLTGQVVNLGFDTIHNFEVNWNANELFSGIYYWSGTLFPGDTTSALLLGSVPFLEGYDYSVTLITANPNSLTDYEPQNDTISFAFHLSVLLNFGTDTTVCPGASVLLMADSIYLQYAWSTGDTVPVINATDPGLYVCQVIDSIQCLRSDSFEIFWFPVEVPVITVSGDTLFSSTPTGNQWYFNGSQMAGETNNYHVAFNAGSYSVSHFDANGCETFSDSVYFLATAVAPGAKHDNIILFPNPVSGKLFISGFTSTDDLIVENLYGVIMTSAKISNVPGNLFSVDVSRLESGPYFVSIRTSKSVIRKQIIVSR